MVLFSLVKNRFRAQEKYSVSCSNCHGKETPWDEQHLDEDAFQRMIDEASEMASESAHVQSPCNERYGTDLGLNRDLEWESHAASCRFGVMSDQLKEMQSWNALWVQPYRTGPGRLLQEMLTIDETTLHELCQPLPTPVESMTVEPEVLIRARRVRIEKTEGDMRRLAIQKLKAVILIDPQATRLGQTLAPSKGREISDEEIRTSLDHAFSAKAGSTLYKRACSLIRYVEWCTKNADQHPLELTEEKLYSYLIDLKEVGGSTSGSGFIEALRFLNGVAQFARVDLPQVISASDGDCTCNVSIQKTTSTKESYACLDNRGTWTQDCEIFRPSDPVHHGPATLVLSCRRALEWLATAKEGGGPQSRRWSDPCMWKPWFENLCDKRDQDQAGAVCVHRYRHFWKKLGWDLA